MQILLDLPMEDHSHPLSSERLFDFMPRASGSGILVEFFRAPASFGYSIVGIDQNARQGHQKIGCQAGAIRVR
jgi:hypothetical protein